MVSTEIHGRMFRALMCLIAGAFLLACLTAPYIFNVLVFLGRTVELLESWRGISFERLISRLVLIYLVLGFYPALRIAGVRSRRLVGLTSFPEWPKQILHGWALGLISVALLVFCGWLVDAYTWNPDPWGRLLGRVAGYFVGALIIALIEEILFRGALFGSLSRRIHAGVAAFLVSLFFAMVHFLRPESATGIVHGHWYSGFQIVPDMFYRTDVLAHYIPFALTLFVMSMVLCALYDRQQHVYFIIGLHAGWVLTLQTSRFFFDRNLDAWPVFFGTSANTSRSWGALLLLLVFWAVVSCLPRQGSREAGHD